MRYCSTRLRIPPQSEGIRFCPACPSTVTVCPACVCLTCVFLLTIWILVMHLGDVSSLIKKSLVVGRFVRLVRCAAKRPSGTGVPSKGGLGNRQPLGTSRGYPVPAPRGFGSVHGGHRGRRDGLQGRPATRGTIPGPRIWDQRGERVKRHCGLRDQPWSNTRRLNI